MDTGEATKIPMPVSEIRMDVTKLFSAIGPSTRASIRGANRYIQPSHDIPENTETGHEDDVGEAVPDGKDPEVAEDHDHRVQNPQGEGHGLNKHPGEIHPQDKDQKVAHDHAAETGLDDLGIRNEYHRSGIDAGDQEGPQDDGRGCAPGDAQGEHGHHGAGGAGIVRRLRGEDPFDDPGAEFLRVLGELLGNPVGEHRRDGRPGRGDRSDDDTDETAPRDVEFQVFLDLLPRGKLRMGTFEGVGE